MVKDLWFTLVDIIKSTRSNNVDDLDIKIIKIIGNGNKTHRNIVEELFPNSNYLRVIYCRLIKLEQFGLIQKVEETEAQLVEDASNNWKYALTPKGKNINSELKNI